MPTKYLISRLLLLLLIFQYSSATFAQSGIVKEINSINTPAAGLAPLRFLASDELMGRGTMRPEINIAARYISEYFRSLGLKEVPGTTDYFQPFSITMVTPSSTGSLTLNTAIYKIGKELLEATGGDVAADAPAIMISYATPAELEKADVRGKIIFANMGYNDSSSIGDAIDLLETTQEIAKEKGAVAVIERYRKNIIPWPRLKGYLSREHWQEEKSGIPILILNDSATDIRPLMKNKNAKASISITGTQPRDIPAKNVMAWIEGTDPLLKDQFIVLSAHYDHLGVADHPKMEEGKMDSIYNGARDNAIGTTAVMDAAAYFAQHPPKRSVLFMAYTAEEIGEIGSKYFAAHPTLPLNKLVYNLNIDNASYNDTSIISVIGLGRTSADEDIKKACAAYGLTAMPDPAPEENLFDRSDNTNLAVKGIPAPTYSLGMKKMDDEIFKRYHRLSDEVGNFNLGYAMKYINSFILAAKYIADDPTQPYWIKGDKYEEAWKMLYNKK
jgi:hypothetical protein